MILSEKAQRLTAWSGGGNCMYCGRREANKVIEHIIPRSRGGKDGGRNLAVACHSCNCLKRDMTLEEWREVIEHRYGGKVLFAFECEPMKSLMESAGSFMSAEGEYADGYSEPIDIYRNATARIQL